MAALDYTFERREKLFRAEEREQGRQEGRAEGLAEGITQGELLARINTNNRTDFRRIRGKTGNYSKNSYNRK